MRLRERRRIEKRARIAAHRWPRFIGAGPEKLLQIAADTPTGWYLRAQAVLLLGQKKTPVLLEQFFSQVDEVEIWETAAALECGGGPDVIEPMIHALYDPNPYRRKAAARCLGWNHPVTPKAAKALTAALNDLTQPHDVRIEAAHSLAYSDWRQATPALVAAIKDQDVVMRFWATIALGGMRHLKSRRLDPQAIAALESLLGDREPMPGNYWWSPGQEALATLGRAEPAIPKYTEMLAREIEQIQNDSQASPQSRNWAESYSEKPS